MQSEGALAEEPEGATGEKVDDGFHDALEILANSSGTGEQCPPAQQPSDTPPATPSFSGAGVHRVVCDVYMSDEGPSALEDVVERLQAQLEAALAAREQEERELMVSQRQTDSAVNQLREAQLRMDHLEVRQPGCQL